MSFFGVPVYVKNEMPTGKLAEFRVFAEPRTGKFCVLKMEEQWKGGLETAMVDSSGG